jgi:hypothetical protein
MKPIIHFIVGDYAVREELKEIFKKENEVIINNDKIDTISGKILYISLTTCLATSILKINKIYLELFKHEKLLTEELNRNGHYNNKNEVYIPYNSYIMIEVPNNDAKILYIPIKYDYNSNVPLNHIYMIFDITYKEYQKYDIEKIVIPLDSIIIFNINNSINNIITKNIYHSYKQYF